MALADLRDVKGSVIQIDRIAYAICRLCRYFLLVGRNERSDLLLSLIIREITIDAKILSFLLIVHSSAIILEAVSLHRTVHIALRRLLCFCQRLIIQLVIKAVFKVMVGNHQIRRSHTFCIAVNRFFGQPFRLFRQSIVQFAHFGDLLTDAACPQMADIALTSAQEILAISTKTIQQAVVLSNSSNFSRRNG